VLKGTKHHRLRHLPKRSNFQYYHTPQNPHRIAINTKSSEAPKPGLLLPSGRLPPRNHRRPAPRRVCQRLQPLLSKPGGLGPRFDPRNLFEYKRMPPALRTDRANDDLNDRLDSLFSKHHGFVGPVGLRIWPALGDANGSILFPLKLIHTVSMIFI